MWNYIGRRLVFAIPTLFGVSIIMFFLIFIAPGDPLTALLPPDASAEQKAKLAAQKGLDRPIHVQYGIWIKNAVQGDLGESIHRGTPVFPEVMKALRNTLLLAVSAAVISMTLVRDPGDHRGIQPGPLAGQTGQRHCHHGGQFCPTTGWPSCWLSPWRSPGGGSQPRA